MNSAVNGLLFAPLNHKEIPQNPQRRLNLKHYED